MLVSQVVGKGLSLSLLVKQYSDGEVSRYLHSRSLGADIELCGPKIESSAAEAVKDNGHWVFLAGGTGITPAIQFAQAKSTASIDIFYSSRDPSESSYLAGLVKTHKSIRIHNFHDSEGEMITERDIPRLPQPAIAVVSGPDGYVDYIAGRRNRDTKRRENGILAKAGWKGDICIL